MPGSKKDKKNGKEGGGAVAAVTRHQAKFGNENGIKSLSSSPSPPPILSPDLKPASPPTDIQAPSPLLDAISTTSFATSNSPNTREWAKAISAGMAGSPGNLISLVGESPPTAPSSYEDTRGLASGWSSPRPATHYYPPSISPPSAGVRRPLSFQLEGHYPPDPHGQIAAASARRGSMHSHYAQVRAASNPPLPHQPQAHFYGAPDLDFDTQSQSGMKAGAKGYYFGFDSLPTAYAGHPPGRDTVVLAGYEGGLEVHAVGKKGLEHLAGLKGLRGGVYQAMVLPWTPAGSDWFPLVALVIHGPNLPLPTPGINIEGDYDAVSAERSEAMADALAADVGPKEGMSVRTAPGFVESYQTTVDVYSLKTGRPVCVLLEAPKIPLKMPIASPIFKAPPPSGAFHLRADAGTILVSSGVTGECWVYRQMLISPEQGVQFRCLGKLWTTLQQPLKGDSTPETERGRAQAPPRPRPQAAIVSMNGRWIAYCPAAPSSQIAMRARVTVPSVGRAPGLSSMTPPQLPTVNSDVDVGLSESVMNKIMRDATQELIQGAKWVGKHGLQAWNNYWNPHSGQPVRAPMPSTQAWVGPSVRPDASQFPPTHGTVAPSVPKEPGLVSILDIETLGSSASLHPITTFAVPNGCSFLSFSPTGLFLFTASSKGDVQTVWDLMRIQNTKSSPLQVSAWPFTGGPRVRQVAQFSRMTVARIVDVAWTRPSGERVAMVTERGTVHLLDLPSSAFTWPPPRRRIRPQEGTGPLAETPTSAVSIASNALNTVRDAARPLMTRPRRSSSNVPQLTSAGIGDYATHGGKVIAASISHSLGKTGHAINQLRHTRENRVSLPNSLPNALSTPGPSCVVWITGRRDHSLFVLGDGLVRSFPTKGRRASAIAERHMAKSSDFRLPYLPDDNLAPSVKAYIDPEEYLDLTEKDSDAGNHGVPLDQRPRVPPQDLSAESSIPQAEIESSAPYQPFHTDRRVALFECDVGGGVQDLTSSQMSSSVSTLPVATQLEDSTAELTPRRKPSKMSRAMQLRQEEAQAQSQSQSQSQSQYQYQYQGPSRTRGASVLKPAGAWAFGQPIKATKLDLGLPDVDEELMDGSSPYGSRALPASAMERVLHRTEDDAQIVVTTRRRRGAGRSAEVVDQDDDGFFEDDCEVLDFADQRV